MLRSRMNTLPAFSVAIAWSVRAFGLTTRMRRRR
jgi:hypothetical protein